MLEYLLYLYKQFCSSVNKPCKCTAMYYDLEFQDWICHLPNLREKYQAFLNSIGVQYDSPSTIEINKGKYDSLGNISDLTVVSPFANSMDLEDKTFNIYKGKPLIISGCNIDEADFGKLFMTYNPYNNSCYGDLHILHENEYPVCIGVCGSEKDDDRDLKMRFIKYVYDLMNRSGVPVRYVEEVYEGDYFSCALTETSEKTNESPLVLVKK